MKLPADQAVKDILDGAAELPDGERSAFLDIACGEDARLRAEVDSLLAALGRDERFLADPTVGSDNPALAGLDDGSDLGAITPLGEGPGTRIGPYKLLQLIGEGGFGSVFMAEQETPVRRKVALKIIKLGMDSAAVIARFEAERQALAMMDHPNIAPIYEAGATDSGRPYFVMELVQGTPITQYCDNRRLTPRERLELFVPVCQAIQHAHQKGIIHRDLKPSNILVMICDGKPIPKIIDFGVAKALHQRLTEKTLFTHFGSAVGTPQYMSPEQAELDVKGADTRSDVYSLGAILYELLAGSTPLDARTLREAGYAQMLKIIREQEPPLPSTRLSASGEALASLAALRDTESRKLTRLVAGDLDWIVMKCLEKDRSRRYETPSALAHDIERYLGGESVEAVPPSAVYKIRKFVGKHQLPLGIAAGFAVVLIAATVISSWQAVRATRARDAEARQRTLAERARAGEAAQRKQAEAVAGLLESVFRGLDPYAETKGAPDLRTQLGAQLDRAGATLDKDYGGEPQLRARLRNALGETQLGLGEYGKAEALFRAAADEQRQHAGPDDPLSLTATDNLAKAYRFDGRYAEAIKLHEQVRDRRMMQLGPDHPDTLATLHNLARAYQSVGRIAEAIKIFEEVRDRRIRTLGLDHPDTLSTLNYLASAYRSAGRNAEATRLWDQVRDQRIRTLGPDHPDTLLTLNNIALGYTIDEGRYPEAIKLLEQVRDEQIKKLGPGHPDSLTPLTNLANAYGDAGRYAEAIKLLEEVRDDRTKNLGADHPDTLETRHNLAFWCNQAGRTGEAIKLLEKVRDQRMKQLGPDHRDTLRTLVSLASAYRGAHRYAEAIQIGEQVRDQQMKRLGPDHPDTLRTIDGLATAYRVANRTDEAIKLHEHVRDQYVKTRGPEHQITLEVLNELAWDYVYAGRKNEAVKLWEKELDGEMKTLGAGNPDTVRTTVNLATGYLDLGRTDEADKLWGPVSREFDRRIKEMTAALTTRPHDAALLADRGRLYARLGRFQPAADDFAKAIDLEPGHHLYWHEGLVPLLLQNGDVEEYRRRRSQELARFRTTSDSAVAHRVAKDAFMVPLEGDQLRITAELADRALADAHQEWGYQTKGLAEYRSGHYREAIPWLIKSTQGSKWGYCDTIADLFVAMSYERLGDHKQSRATLGHATHAMDHEFPRAGERDLALFCDWIVCQVARREADELINGNGPTTRAVATTQPAASH